MIKIKVKAGRCYARVIIVKSACWTFSFTMRSREWEWILGFWWCGALKFNRARGPRAQINIIVNIMALIEFAGSCSAADVVGVSRRARGATVLWIITAFAARFVKPSPNCACHFYEYTKASNRKKNYIAFFTRQISPFREHLLKIYDKN